MIHTAPEILARNAESAFTQFELLETDRHGAHRALDSRGQQFRQQIEQSIGVGQAVGRSPVGLRDLLLHARPVKRSVGKSVDGEDITVVAAQPFLKRSEDRGL